MRVLLVIPARFRSARYPGKPLAALRGATGEARSLIRRSWDAAVATPGVARVVVATDDARIADHALGFGAEVAMTSERHRNGTERCAEALDTLCGDWDVVVNLQGDAPLTPPGFVSALIDAMRAEEVDVATPVLRCDPQTFANLRDDRRAGRVGGTTAVFDRTMRALYFSKEVIPFADAVDPSTAIPVFHHVGLYAYRPRALRAYAQWAPGALEQLEGLEQLRFLENGVAIRCVEVSAEGRVFWELNNPVDVERIEAALAAMGQP